MALTTQQVETLYLAYLGRKGSAEEVALWQTLEITQEFAATSFYNSPEAQARGLTDNATYINQIYNDLFNRDAETAGLNAWLQLLTNGFPRDQIALAIANTALSNPSGADGQTLQAAISDVPPGPGPGPEPTPGETFMLTTGVDLADGSGSSHDGVADTFKFTNGNEKIVLNNDGSGNYDVKSLSAKDSLKDVSTTDNDILQLNFALAAGSNIIGAKNIGSGVTIENIEEIDIIGSGANRTVFDNTLKATGLKTLKISGDFVGFDFNGKVIKDLTKIDATGITSVKSGVTLDASGAKQSLTIDGPNFAATVKGGAGDDIITAQGSVDGGAGNDIIYYTGESTVNGGAGDDIIEAAANAAEGAVVIDGGAGKDLITVNGEATVNGGDNDDIITINGAADVSVNGDAGKDKFIFSEGYAGTGTIGDLTTEDTLHINAGVVNATISGAAYDGTNLKVVSGAALTLELASSATATTIDISAAKIDEGATININGGTGADTITGSKQSDIITGGAGADSITGGSGADTFVFADTQTNNGTDTITDFSFTDGDVLDVKAFLGAEAEVQTITSTASTAATGNVFVLNSVAAAEATNKLTGLAVGKKYVVVVTAATSSTAAKVIYFTATSASETLSDLSGTATVNLTGVFDDNVSDFTNANFVGA